MFDSRQYEWNDLSFVLGGRNLTAFTGVKYAEKQEKELLYGKGNEPLSIQKGNKGYEGEITLLQSELETLRAVAKNRSILNLQLDAVVCYGNPSEGDVMITDFLQGIQFTESPKEMKQGDKNMEITLPFIFLRLK
ncbi:MAG: hypothetical protein FWC34_09055 [Bacteroidetes bacterium]|nr:hypothetical protein [Bacteroidota bacterium]